MNQFISTFSSSIAKNTVCGISRLKISKQFQRILYLTPIVLLLAMTTRVYGQSKEDLLSSKTLNTTALLKSELAGVTATSDVTWTGQVLVTATNASPYFPDPWIRGVNGVLYAAPGTKVSIKIKSQFVTIRKCSLETTLGWVLASVGFGASYSTSQSIESETTYRTLEVGDFPKDWVMAEVERIKATENFKQEVMRVTRDAYLTAGALLKAMIAKYNAAQRTYDTSIMSGINYYQLTGYWTY